MAIVMNKHVFNDSISFAIIREFIFRLVQLRHVPDAIHYHKVGQTFRIIIDSIDIIIIIIIPVIIRRIVILQDEVDSREEIRHFLGILCPLSTDLHTMFR